MTRNRYIQLTFFSIIVLWSLISPYEYFTWFPEALPAIVVVILLAATYKRFRFTELSYWLILMNCIILLIGAHYTYARVPLFDNLKDILELSRNNYDKIGYLAQGFITAIIIREILLRTSHLKERKWLSFISASIALAISAFYELVEWWSALLFSSEADDFLGTQGYIWDMHLPVRSFL